MRVPAVVGLLVVLTARPTDAAEPSPPVGAFLEALERAYAGEDLAAVTALAHPDYRDETRRQVAWIFKERNYFVLSHRVLEERAGEEGRIEVDVVTDLRSRRVEERQDRREKGLRRYVLRPVGGSLLLEKSRSLPLPGRLPDAAWVPEEWVLRVATWPAPARPFATPEGRVDVEARVRLRNVAARPLAEVRFGLHPFVERLRAGPEGAPLQVRRLEGPVDQWVVALGEPVDVGAATELELSYSFEQVGRSSGAFVGPRATHLFSTSAWHPIFSNPLPHDLARAAHDLIVEVPDGQVALAPGVLASEEDAPGGRRRFRWFSRFPGSELPIVIGRFDRSEVRLSPSLTLELYRAEGASPRDHAVLVDVLTSMATAGEALLGPPPTDRLVVVEHGGTALHGAPAFLALSQFGLEKTQEHELRHGHPFFFLAHRLAHLWFVDDIRAMGPALHVLTESLCDHFASTWAGDHLDPDLPRFYRELVLGPAAARQDSDRPLTASAPGQEQGDVFGQGKGMVVLDAYRTFAGEAAWRDALSSYYREHRGGIAELPDLLRALARGDARLEDYVGTWFAGEGFSDPRVVRVTSEPLAGESGPYRVEVEVSNAGVGPVPVEMVVRTAGRTGVVRTPTLELGSHETSSYAFEAPTPAVSVVLDPHRLTWQSDVRNDEWPQRRRTRRDLLKDPVTVDPDQLEALKGRLGSP